MESANVNSSAAPAHGTDGPTGQVSLSIVIPAYNEASRLGRTLERIREYAIAMDWRCEVILVDDGSQDGTADLVRGFAAGPMALQLLVNPGNRGKGYSVRRGMLAAAGESVLMCDADLSTPIEEVGKLLYWLGQGYEVAIGSRDMPDSILSPPQPLSRRILGTLMRAVRRRIVLPRLSDTQCGFKCFTRQAAQQIFASQTIDGFAFDCEVLALADGLGYRIREVGVMWCDDRDSRVRPLQDGWHVLVSLLRIRWGMGHR